MITLDSLGADEPTCVFLAIRFAEKALPVWQKEYPKDMRPKKAIKAAKCWLNNPSDAAAKAVGPAALAASDASNGCADWADANDASDAVALAASNAADAAAFAAWAAADAHAASYHAADAQEQALHAADAACDALDVEPEQFIHKVILENFDWIIEYKIKNEQSFAEPQIIIDYLDESQVLTLLFNLNKVA